MTPESKTLFAEFLIKFMQENVITFAIGVLVPVMLIAWVVAICFRLLIYYTVKRHEWFASEFEKRVNKFIEGEIPGKVTNVSFFSLTKRLLERTFYEVFELRDRLKRRRSDKVMGPSDRIFLIKQGCAWLVKDILKQAKFLRWSDQQPKLFNITRNTFMQNPHFNRVFGIFQIGLLNDIIAVLPSLFVIGGIFGTFLGIVKGLPKLGGMNLTDMELTKQVMDGFLNEISFAMNSSIIGIFLSVTMTFANTLWSADKAFGNVIDRFEGSLDLLWNRSDNNSFPTDERKFDEHKDPLDALAEEAVNSEIVKTVRSRELDKVRKTAS